MSRDAQLRFFDSAGIHWAERGQHRDEVLWSTFAHSDSVSDEALTEQLQNRIEASPVLNRRLYFSPLGLDYPYWVYGIDEVGPLVSVVSEAGLDWADCRARFAELLSAPLDPTVAPLRVTVFRRVTGVPGAALADVAAVVINTALLPSRNAGHVTEYLFADRQLRWFIDGLPAAAVDLPRWRAAVRSARVVAQAATSIALRIKTRRVRSGLTAPARSTWWGAEYWGAGARREVEILEVPVPSDASFSTAEMCAGAVASALDRFHNRPVESSVVPIDIPISVPFGELMGAHNVLDAHIDVDASTDDPTTLVSTVHAKLQEQRSRLRSLDSAKLIAARARTPYFANRACVRRTRTSPQAEVLVSSTSLAPASDLALAGQRHLNSGAVPSEHVAVLGHVLWTFNGVTTLQIAAKPKEAGAVARYTELLREELDRVVAAAPR